MCLQKIHVKSCQDGDLPAKSIKENAEQKQPPDVCSIKKLFLKIS